MNIPSDVQAPVSAPAGEELVLLVDCEGVADVVDMAGTITVEKVEGVAANVVSALVGIVVLNTGLGLDPELELGEVAADELAIETLLELLLPLPLPLPLLLLPVSELVPPLSGKQFVPLGSA